MSEPETVTGAGRVLLIACGALGREMVDVIRLNGLGNFTVTCLPAIWHNRPERIPEGVREKIRSNRGSYDKIFVLYGDCGTGGELDRVLAEEGGIERIDGPHCYAFFSGVADFLKTAEQDVDCFYLTDYLVRHFERLIIKGLGIDRHPQLLPMYFGNYSKLIYLAQTDSADFREMAVAAAEKLGLAYEYRFTGYGELGRFIVRGAEEHRVEGA